MIRMLLRLLYRILLLRMFVLKMCCCKGRLIDVVFSNFFVEMLKRARLDVLANGVVRVFERLDVFVVHRTRHVI